MLPFRHRRSKPSLKNLPNCLEGRLTLPRWWGSRREAQIWGTMHKQTSMGLRVRSRIYPYELTLLGLCTESSIEDHTDGVACCLLKLLLQRAAMRGRLPQNSLAFILCRDAGEIVHPHDLTKK